MHSGKSTAHFTFVNEWLSVTVVWETRTNGLWNPIATTSGVVWDNLTSALII